jgi:quercetin dioxygenase-like cupin family protein
MGEKRPAAVPTAQIDNDRARVTEWRFPPGAETEWHRHEYDYVVVPLTAGELLLETETGPNTTMLEVGKSYFRALGVEHNVINANAHEMAFIEIEFK